MLRTPNARRGLGAVFALVCLMFAAAPARSDSKNLLVNPDFEQSLPGHPWMPAGWDTSRAGYETVFFGRDGFSAHSGQFGVNVANASGTVPLWNNWSQTIDVTPEMVGKDIVFSVWTRSNGVEGRGYVLVQAFRDTVGKYQRLHHVSDRGTAAQRAGFPGVNDPIADLGWRRESFAERETDWTRREVRTYVAPSSDVVTVRMGLFGTGQVLFDDASLTLEDAVPAEVPPLHVNLLRDPVFEGNSLAWELSTPPFPPLIAARDSSLSHSGKACMHMSCETGLVTARMGVSQVITNRALSGQRLRFRAWAKAKNLGSAVHATLYFHTLTGIERQVSTMAAYETQDWQPLVVEADVPPDTYAIWAMLDFTTPVRGHAYFDDASLEVLGPATGAPTPGLVTEAPTAPSRTPPGTSRKHTPSR